MGYEKLLLHKCDKSEHDFILQLQPAHEDADMGTIKQKTANRKICIASALFKLLHIHALYDAEYTAKISRHWLFLTKQINNFIPLTCTCG